jgi:hypothetical protein
MIDKAPSGVRAASILGLAVFGALLALSACTLGGQSGNVGLECEEARDCDADELGCVPVDEQNPAGERVCMPPHADWTCRGELFGDTACDCGCGLLDVDCPTELSSSCAVDGNNCPPGQNPVPTDNTRCQ